MPHGEPGRAARYTGGMGVGVLSGEVGVKSALDVHRELLAAAVPHEIVRLRTSISTADQLPEVLGLEPASCAAVRCYVADAEPAGRGKRVPVPAEPRLVAVLVHAGTTPDPASLAVAAGGARLRLATVAEVNRATDYAAGLVSPLSLPPEVLLLADAALGEKEVLYVPVGEGRVVLGIRTGDLLRACGARVAALSARAHGPSDEPARVIDLEGRVVRR